MPRSQISATTFRIGCLVSATFIVLIAVFTTVERFPQPLWYHQFVDQRTLFSIPNMLNVVSNLPFVVVGIWGLAFMAKPASRTAFVDARERWPFWVYFAGLALTGIGSAYYHAEPNNDRLVWDRLPLMVTFMGLFVSVIGERIDVRLATWLLAPLVALAAGSVIHWHVTEQAGDGDLRFYLVMQFYPIIALLALLLLFPPKYTRTADLIASLAAYGLAKALEVLDGQVYARGGIVSGHTLKHLVAGLGAYLILHMLQRRKPLATNGS